jgi:hypothetical protein
MAEESTLRFSLFWQMNGWFGLIIVGVALLVLGLAAVLAAADEREESARIETEGTVSRLGTVRRPKSEGGGFHHIVHVDFMVDGEQTFGSQLIQSQDAEQLSEGQTITVRYLPDEPHRIWVARDVDGSLASALRLFGFPLLFFGCFLVWAAWVSAGNQLKQSRTSLTK